MANENDNILSDSDKLRIVADFILHAPPGEFREVFHDVRHLVNNDALLKDKATKIFAEYRKDHLTPVNLSNGNDFTLITEFNDLGSNRFYDPKTRKSFTYDYLTEETSDHGPWEPDATCESWRTVLDEIWANYCADHYYKGISSVFATNNNDHITLSACIEAHQFQPNNFWYDEKSLAENFKNIVEEAENEYQIAISQNYQNMSDTTFKALRRALPVTRSKIDWHKIMSYRIASDIKQS
ncbi:F-actin-capping protein subunit alpha-like protein [Euroglyphus maynei]|uniref:F-actin-capping protein subunit alpha n=1 Tax=Euroglyphus maynei TaxID=6958 RepID=A0A1Y3B8Q5_EURMA|nr:F-actin-capping protein subunit alpha-like protein [Euroglyphus maynei]